MIVIGAVLAGLILFLREALPLLAAARSGVIHTRGARRQAVSRSDDPQRFAGLFRHRRNALVWPLLVIGIGLGYGVLQVLQYALRTA